MGAFALNFPLFSSVAPFFYYAFFPVLSLSMGDGYGSSFGSLVTTAGNTCDDLLFSKLYSFLGTRALTDWLTCFPPAAAALEDDLLSPMGGSYSVLKVIFFLADIGVAAAPKALVLECIFYLFVK